MRCPNCKSKKVQYEISSGFPGYRCDDCNEWNYVKDMRADKVLRPKKVLQCQHCNTVHQLFKDANQCCNPV